MGDIEKEQKWKKFKNKNRQRSRDLQFVPSTIESNIREEPCPIVKSVVITVGCGRKNVREWKLERRGVEDLNQFFESVFLNS